MAVAEGTGEQPDIASRSAKGERAAGGTGAVSLWLKLLNIGPLLILVLLAAVISLLTPNFLKPGNLSNILAQTAVIAIVAVGQHLVIRTWWHRPLGRRQPRPGDGHRRARLPAGRFRAAGRAGDHPPGAAVGAINGCVYVFGRLPHAFIITLATLSICRGLALELAIGHTTMRGMPDAIAQRRAHRPWAFRTHSLWCSPSLDWCC